MTHQLKRRGFLGFLGGAVAAGPAAAKQAADGVVLQHLGYPSNMITAAASSFVGGEPAEVDPTSDKDQVAAHFKLFRWIRRNGIPRWHMNEIHERANRRCAYGLDPDLAALRSCSPAYKAIRQRHRNLNREIEVAMNRVRTNGERVAFRSKAYERFGGYVDLDLY